MLAVPGSWQLTATVSGRQQQILQQISKFKENWMLVLNYDNVIFSFIFDISWGHIQLTTHMITLWLHSWTCSGTSLWSNWEPGNMVMNPLIIEPNIIFIVPLAVNLSLSSIPRRQNWAVEPYLMYSAISSTLEFTLSLLLFHPPRQLIACWVYKFIARMKNFPYWIQLSFICLQNLNPILHVMI